MQFDPERIAANAEDLASAVHAFGEMLPADVRILDVGCGLRPYEHCFPPGNYTGVDVKESGRSSADKVPDRFYDGLTLPFPDSSFGAILCTQVLEHCAQPDILTGEMRRVLHPGGLGLITVPLLWGEHEVPFDFRRFTTFGTRRLLESAGFEVILVERITRGIDAVAGLVQSEINASDRMDTRPKTFIRKQRERFAHHLWRIQRRVWKGLYSFPRIYLDNLAIVRKN